MIIVLDLDDTLYDELSFVKSGFKIVSFWLYQNFSIPQEESFSFMIEELFQKGRGKIFDSLLEKYSIYTKQNLKKCISLYRKHKPDIKLYPEAEDFLERLKKYPIYLVTDGNKTVQKNKIISLGLDKKVKSYILTHCYGIKNAKPSPYCFLKICEKEKVSPLEVVCIGDNPYKDFVNLKTFGFKTIRILKGQYKDIFLEEKFEAEYRFNSLSEITEEFLMKITSKNLEGK
jgi:putative hydrolase of the HAD superfamily